MNYHLKDKVVIVTGAASGIGAASAKAFAREGASVVVADVQIARGEELVARIQSEDGKAIFVKCDVSNESDVKNMVRKTVEKFGRLDCAFNNAGVEGESTDTMMSTTENWDKIMNINLKGVWLCMKYEIEEMLKTGGGSIVNCSSIAGIVGFAGLSAYTASKHGVIGLTQATALEFADKNIRVNAICPGVIQTPMVERVTHGDATATRELVSAEPMGRMGKPEEIAEAALWLCSDASSFITGHPLVADGGWVAR
ncbi:MAG: SDR family oxidoreductase [Bacteriovorax sp.]|jgi:NAD(P)-dependent dehydrogenase (short-subunit alcohol dehydrogenase family)